MKEFDDLRNAVLAKRHKGRMKEIRKAFKKYEDSLGLTRLERIRKWILGQYLFQKIT